MGWLFDEDDAAKQFQNTPTPDLSVPPPTIDKDEPGLQDATVSDAAMVAPLAGPAMDMASGIADTGASLLGDEAGAIFPDGLKGTKVVGADGNPLTVYHGTDAKFDKFDLSQSGKNSRAFPQGDNIGHFFSTDRDFASGYGPVKEAHINLKNPYPMQKEDFETALNTLGGKGLQDSLKAKGHDGIELLPKNEQLGRFTVTSPRNYVAFDPAQIHSKPQGYATGGTVMPSKKKEPIEMNSMQKGLQSLAIPKFADGGEVDPSQLPAPDLSLSGGAPVRPATSQFDVQDVAGNDTPISTNGATPSDSPGMDKQLMAAILAQRQQEQSQMPAQAPQMPPAAPIMPQGPSMQQAAQSLSGIPATNPNIYQGMTADDRLALQKQLMAKMNSGGNLTAQGLGGIADAISNSYGHKNTSFQNDITANNQKQMENTLGAADTFRGDKLQDIQGNQAAQLADPNSALSQSLRKTLQSAGLKVPSGMSGQIMLQVSGPLGELAMKQATLAVQQQQANAAQANAGAERRIAAAKDLGDRGIVRKGLDMFDATKSPETQVLQDELHETNGKPTVTKGAAQPVMPQSMQTKSGIKYTVN